MKDETKIASIIKDMFFDDRLVFNARTIEEAELFIDLCDILDIEKKSANSLVGEDYFNVYEENLCFILEDSIIEYCDIEYFTKSKDKDYRIINIDKYKL